MLDPMQWAEIRKIEADAGYDAGRYRNALTVLLAEWDWLHGIKPIRAISAKPDGTEGKHGR